jgi:hypothetical protein
MADHQMPGEGDLKNTGFGDRGPRGGYDPSFDDDAGGEELPERVTEVPRTALIAGERAAAKAAGEQVRCAIRTTRSRCGSSSSRGSTSGTRPSAGTRR